MIMMEYMSKIFCLKNNIEIDDINLNIYSRNAV